MTPLEQFFEAFNERDYDGALQAVRDGVNGSDMGPNGLSVFSCALMGGRLDLVDALISADKSLVSEPPDANRLLPVDYAFAGTLLVNLNAVLAAGADPNRLNGDGLPALQQAIVGLHDSLYQLRDETDFYRSMAVLTLYGADPAALNAKGQDFSAFATEKGRPDLIGVLAGIFEARSEALANGEDLLAIVLGANGGAVLDEGPDWSSLPPEFLSTVFLEACKIGDSAEVARLAKSGAPVDAVDAKEGSALILAIKSGSLPTVQSLLDLGADESAEFVGSRGPMLPLHVAAAMGSAEMCKALVQSGADVEARLAGDLTPSMLALVSERWENLASLIKLGADTQAVNSEGKNLDAMAREAGHEDIAHWIGLAVHSREVSSESALPEPPAKPRSPR